MSVPSYSHTFTSARRGKWLDEICKLHTMFSDGKKPHRVLISFSADIQASQIEPVHLVTLACMIQFLDDKGHIVLIGKSNPTLYDYIMEELNFSEYWKGGKNHVEAKDSDNIFNLWRIIDTEKDLYAANVATYFNRTYFKDKDLSALSVSLVEAFYNVFDHAQANKNAFLLLRFDPEKQQLQVAISDFGIGIVNSVRRFNPSVASSDPEAIQWAMRDHSTVKSTSHNKGLGMGNILAIADEARIFSGNGLIVMRNENTRAFTVNFTFPGTLIYMNVNLASFDDIEILDSFTW